VSPGLAAILNATTPFFAVLIANAFTADERLSVMRVIGSLAGLGGVTVMIGIDAAGTASLPHQLAFVLASLFYAAGSVFGRRFAPLSPLVAAAAQSAGTALWLLPVVLVVDHPWTLAPPSARVGLAILALAVLCTTLAFVLYFAILRRAGATNLVLVMFLTPVSAILLGWLFLHEQLGAHHALGMVAIAGGLVLIDGRVYARVRQSRRISR
jgi:drug/metabolite transporter (DMT)-like permease